MMIGVIALTAALAALAVVLLAARAGRRERAASDAHITAALVQLGTRMDALAADLSVAIDRAHEDEMRGRALGELGGTLDLDEALSRTVEAMTAIHGVDAAVVRTAALDGSPLVGSSGIPADEAQRQLVTGPPDGHGARAVALTYIYPDGEEPPGALRSGVSVPLEADGEPIGFVAVYSHDQAPRLSPDALARLEAIAAAAGPAIDTARRFREATASADQDTVTGLPGRRSFHDTLSREVARALRYERRLSLLVLDVDDFHDVNDRLGQLGGDEVLAETAALLRAAVREADVAYRAGGDEFAVLLPESTRIDAEGLFARVQATARRHQAGVSLSGGIAELQSGDDALTILERAEEALHHAKTAGKGTAA